MLTMHPKHHIDLVQRMSGAAVSASETLVPRPIRSVVDRTLIEAACASRGGLAPVAERLRVDVPAVDAWRSIGVPAIFRHRLAAMIMTPDFTHRRAA